MTASPGPIKIMSTGYHTVGQVHGNPTDTLDTTVRHQGLPIPKSPTVIGSSSQGFILPTASVASVTHRQHNVYVNDHNNLAFAPTSTAFTTGNATVQNILQLSEAQFTTNRLTFKNEHDSKDGVAVLTHNNIVQASNQFKFNGPSYLQGKQIDGAKQQAIEEIAASLADEKNMNDPLITPSVSYPDSQPSPASSNQSITTQVLKSLGSDNVNDTMLSAINYDPVSGTLGVEDALLSSNNLNTPSSSTFDLFDGNSNMSDYNIEGQQDLQLSPQTFADSTSNFNLPEGSSLGLADQHDSSGMVLSNHHLKILITSFVSFYKKNKNKQKQTKNKQKALLRKFVIYQGNYTVV